MSIKVRAKFADNKYGFYGGRRRYDGDTFVIDKEGDFSDRWMELAEEEEVRKPLKRGPKPRYSEIGEGGE